jgi:hypothetical protein
MPNFEKDISKYEKDLSEEGVKLLYRDLWLQMMLYHDQNLKDIELMAKGEMSKDECARNVIIGQVTAAALNQKGHEIQKKYKLEGYFDEDNEYRVVDRKTFKQMKKEGKV